MTSLDDWLDEVAMRKVIYVERSPSEKEKKYLMAEIENEGLKDWRRIQRKSDLSEMMELEEKFHRE